MPSAWCASTASDTDAKSIAETIDGMKRTNRFAITANVMLRRERKESIRTSGGPIASASARALALIVVVALAPAVEQRGYTLLVTRNSVSKALAA